MNAPLPLYKTHENFRGNIAGLPMYVVRDEPDVIHVMRDEDGAELPYVPSTDSDAPPLPPR